MLSDMTVTNFYNYGTMNQIEAGATQTNNYYGATAESVPASAYTDEVVGRAIAALNGEEKPLCEKQLFLAVIKVLAAKCGWSPTWAASCERINRLEVAQELAVRCDYNNLKASIALKFAGLDYKDWETYEPRESERAVFRKNRALAKLFEEELDRQLQQPH